MIFDLQPPPEAAAPGRCAELQSVSVAGAAAARLAGRFADATELASCVLQIHPEDADAWYELGAASAAVDAREAARRAWLHTLDLAPANDDARLGLARLAWRDGDLAAARRWLNAISPARRNDAEAQVLEAALDQAAPSQGAMSAILWRLDAGAARSTLSGGLPDWTEEHVSVFRREGATGLGLAIEHARRFDREDLYLELQATHKAGSLVWSLALGGAPDAEFRPERSIRLGVERYDERWQIGGAFTHAEYALGPVEKFDIRAAYDLGADFWVQASTVFVRDENGQGRSGYGLGATWRPIPDLAIDAGWSDAPESSDGTTVDVRSSVLAATFTFSPELHARFGVVHEMRDAYDRTEASVGLVRTF